MGTPKMSDPMIEDIAKFSNHNFIDIKEEQEISKRSKKSPVGDSRREVKKKKANLKFNARKTL